MTQTHACLNQASSAQTYLVAGVAVPLEVLTLYSDDAEETQDAIRGMWQALHLYEHCWMYAEPLHGELVAGEEALYKCRFATSHQALFNPRMYFIDLLPWSSVQTIIQTPGQKIEWEVVEEKQVIDEKPVMIMHPVNVAGRYRDWLPMDQQDATPARKASQSTQKLRQSNAQQQSQQRKAAPEIIQLAQKREEKAAQPTCHHTEYISYDLVRQMTTQTMPRLRDNRCPPRRMLPIILLKAVLSQIQQEIDENQNSRERKWLIDRAKNIRYMLKHKNLWWRDRDDFVQIRWDFADAAEGICEVQIGFIPQGQERGQRSSQKKRAS